MQTVLRTPEQRVADTTWATLCARQLSLLEGRACTLFWRGIDTAVLDSTTLPCRERISLHLHAQTGWHLVQAEARYLTDEQWFAHLAKKEFPVTDFIREPHQIDFTPEPDLFHDYFGHLPQMIHPRIANIAHQFGLAYQRADAQSKTTLARLWWHTLEFGLLKERQLTLCLGGGLFSSKEELLHACDASKWVPFDLWLVAKTPKQENNVHPQFFVLESLEQLEDALSVLETRTV